MPPIVSTDFDGVTCPPEVQAEVVNLLLGGAAFARIAQPARHCIRLCLVATSQPDRRELGRRRTAIASHRHRS